MAGDQVRRSACDRAFDDWTWDRVVAECRAPWWQHRARLAQAWLAKGHGREEEARAIAEQLLDTDVAAGAAYLAGYIASNKDADEARTWYERALTAYLQAGRHADASRAAAALSAVPRPAMRFDDQLGMAQLAITEAQRSGDTLVLARAETVLAEAYDWIGMTDAAREHFDTAERLAVSSPGELAHAYFKHAGFLLDLGALRELETSLHYFDDAAHKRDESAAKGEARLADFVHILAFALPLNRADALSQLRRLDEASLALTQAEHAAGPSPDDDQLALLHMVGGYIATRRPDPPAAEALFARADPATLAADYRIRIALDRARMYRRVGDPDRAERAYRDAIALIEQVRSTAQDVELRPRVLARRAAPYAELFTLLADQDRGVEALAIAESLHARAWLDVVLGQLSSPAETVQARTAAQIRQRLQVAASPPLDGSGLMALVGDREALVFLAIESDIWRAHVAHGRVRVERLARDAEEAAYRFRLRPGDQIANERASSVLLPDDLATSRAPLYVVASGALAEVPFAALRVGDQFLIEQRPVARLPGLAALRCAASTWDDRAVVVGDSRGDLPDAAREVQQVATAQGATPQLGSAASRSALQPAHHARLLHIAAHGVATATGRAIALADGDLTAVDVLESGLDPEVVVLTGCATAASDDTESWGGFPSAFLAAGSRHVIATLRSVKDAAAARVTSAYYAQPAAMNPIARLAAAQRALIDVLPIEDWASFAAWGACDAPVTASRLEHSR